MDDVTELVALVGPQVRSVRSADDWQARSVQRKRVNAALAFVGLQCVLAPVWFLAGPNEYVGRQAEQLPYARIATAFAAVAVGVMYWLIARQRKHLPSIAFAVVIPMIGSSVFGFTVGVLDTKLGIGTGLFIGLIGMFWSYTMAVLITAPLALAHAAVLWFLGKKLEILN